MSFLRETGYFDVRTSTGSQEVSLSKFGGASPKVVMVWSCHSPTSVNDGVYTEHIGIVFGAGDASGGMFCTQVHDIHNVGTMSSSRYHSGTHFIYTVNLQANAFEVAADKFSFTLTATDGNARRFMFLALGGTSLSAKIITGLSKTSTGTQAYTGVGFKPDAVIFGGIGLATNPPTNTTDACFHFGATDGTNQCDTGVTAQNGVGTSNTSRTFQPDDCLGTNSVSAAAVDRASIDSLDNDGFTLNYSAADATARHFWAISLKGVTIKVGYTLTGIKTGKTFYDSLGYRPECMIYSCIGPNISDRADHGIMGLGATDGTTQVSVAVYSVNGAGTSNCRRAQYTTDSLLLLTASTTPLERARATFTQQGFHLDFQNTDSTARYFMFIAMYGVQSPRLSKINLGAWNRLNIGAWQSHTSSSANRIKAYVSAAWKESTMKVYSSGAFVTPAVKVYSAGDWVSLQ